MPRGASLQPWTALQRKRTSVAKALPGEGCQSRRPLVSPKPTLEGRQLWANTVTGQVNRKPTCNFLDVPRTMTLSARSRASTRLSRIGFAGRQVDLDARAVGIEEEQLPVTRRRPTFGKSAQVVGHTACCEPG